MTLQCCIRSGGISRWWAREKGACMRAGRRSRRRRWRCSSCLLREVVCDIHSLLVDAVFHSPASKFVSHVLPCSFLIFPMSILGGQACMRACVPTHASTHPGAARREGQRLNRVSRWTFQDLETNDLNSIPFTNTNASKFAKKKTPRANKHKRKRKFPFVL